MFRSYSHHIADDLRKRRQSASAAPTLSGQWARDQVPFPGAAFRQTVSLLIRQNALFAGVIPLGRTEVYLKDIRCPFLNAFAEQDGITPAASSEPLTRLVGSDDASELRLQSGHIGFVVGRQAAKIARPQIADWIRRRSDEAPSDIHDPQDMP